MLIDPKLHSLVDTLWDKFWIGGSTKLRVVYRRSIMQRWLTRAFLVLLFIHFSSVNAQGNIILDVVDIYLWSEYDQPSMLVINEFIVSQDTPLPAKVILRFPKESIITTVAFNSDGSYLVADYEGPVVQEEWQFITLTVTSLDAYRIEYYQPLLREKNQRQFTYRWLGDYLVNQFNLELRIPSDRTSLETNPQLSNIEDSPDNLHLTGTISQNNIKIGQSFEFYLAYERTSDDPLYPFPTSKIRETSVVGLLEKTGLDWLIDTYQDKRGDSFFWIMTSIIGLVITYIVGISALIIGAWNRGSTVFSRSWLTKLASKPLLITPRVGTWALFLGYKKRLQNQSDIVRASTNFYGVPGVDPDGNSLLPDPTGNTLIEAIVNFLDSQNPVLVVAKGGGGKSTLLARFCYLALTNALPTRLKGYQAILITPAYYDSSLVDSIASVLRERDGVAIDKEMTQAQLESGKYLILFDGVSEIIENQNDGLQEILRTARNADYRNCRFIITTRPSLTIPSELDVFQLQSLSTEIILQFMPLYRLSKKREFQVKKQLSFFGKKPINPLLFSMIIEQGKNDKLSSTRSQLYERFFRAQLRVTTDTMWEGWRAVLGEFAKWFMLETGHRGIGIVHETLVDKISNKPGDQNISSLFERSKKYYQLPVESELNLLEKLQASAVFHRSRRWQFAHDTYEEYFAACYIISHLTIHEKLPALGLWTIDDAQIQSFVSVIEFLKEMVDDELLKTLLNTNLPISWREALISQAKDDN